MRLSLFHKLFAVLVITSLSTIMLFAATTHWYMNQSFIRFLNEERAQLLSVLVERLEAHYVKYGDWDALHDNPRSWRRLVMAARGEADNEANADRENPAPPRPRRHPRSAALFTLYAPDKSIIAGRLPFADAGPQVELQHAGKLIGWIASAPVSQPEAPRAMRFARRQLHVLSLGAGVACLLSIIIAFVTARRLTAPIRQIGHAAGSLTRGEFSTRLPPLGRDEIGQLGEDFNVLARSLEQNQSARRRWFADISHELRTPLAIMRGELDAVRDGVRANDPRLLESLGAETARLEHLIEDLYQLARADIGSLDYEFTRHSPGALVTRCLSRFANRLTDAGLTYAYEFDARVEIMADPQRFAQLVDNLLENCIRYVNSPGQLEIILTREAGDAVLRIDDSGPGIDQENYDMLFEPLTRGEQSRGRDRGGAGLGLALCRAIAVAHGGNIRAQRSTLGGLAVIVHIPLAAAA